jgi:hypothetical protein
MEAGFRKTQIHLMTIHVTDIFVFIGSTLILHLFDRGSTVSGSLHYDLKLVLGRNDADLRL